MDSNQYTLAAYQQMVGDSIRMNPYLQGAWVVAELSDVRVAGGHCYMELIEKDALSGQVIAKMRAMIWSNTFRRLYSKFMEGTGSAIQSGLKVLVYGSANHHNVYGLSFTISDIDPSFTLGDLEKQRREILERLRKEGLLDLNRQLIFPPVPQKVAIISAPGAAGLGDFMNHLGGSPEGFVFYPLLVPAVMQGENTARSVMAALEFVESTLDFWDCVVIIRGGGSTADMHGFDNYDLARRVAEFPLPVVVGIGHERDRNVLDEIANIRCKTPTATADFLVECCRKSWDRVSQGIDRIIRYVTERKNGEILRMTNIENRLPLKVKNVISEADNYLKECSVRFSRICDRKISDSQKKLELSRLRL